MKKSKNVAVILALLTGFIGGHRFYLGQPLVAVIYIATLILGWKVPSVLAFYALFLGIDFLILLFSSEESFNKEHNKSIQQTETNSTQYHSVSPTSYVNVKEFISQEILNMLKETNQELVQLWDTLRTDEAILEQFKASEVNEEGLKSCYLHDIIKVAQLVKGGEFRGNSMEGITTLLASQNLINNTHEMYIDKDVHEINSLLSQLSLKGVMDSLNALTANGNPMKIDFSINESPKEKVFSDLAFPALLKLMDSKLFDQYAATLYRFGVIVSKSDGKSSKAEEDRLAKIYQLLHQPLPEKVNKSLKINEQKSNETLDEVLTELRGLIALDSVKEEIETLVNFVRIQLEREKQGLKTTPISYHMVFTGNPGTGKTTVARMVAKIYKHLGVLQRGHLVETDRSGLIAEYAGQTAIKTNKSIDEALDGILFIDEAYALVGEGQDSYGNEAVATLIKRMEDDRGRLVVILAGYSQDMQDFLETNPGFKSRINRYIDFADYESKSMLEIFESLCKKSQYLLGPGVKEKLAAHFENAYQNRDKTFGNGRFVRNTFEKVLENQANRVSKEKQITREMLQLIVEEDV